MIVFIFIENCFFNLFDKNKVSTMFLEQDANEILKGSFIIEHPLDGKFLHYR